MIWKRFNFKHTQAQFSCLILNKFNIQRKSRTPWKKGEYNKTTNPPKTLRKMPWNILAGNPLKHFLTSHAGCGLVRSYMHCHSLLLVLFLCFYSFFVITILFLHFHVLDTAAVPFQILVSVPFPVSALVQLMFLFLFLFLVYSSLFSFLPLLFPFPVYFPFRIARLVSILLLYFINRFCLSFFSCMSPLL